ncbi:MAG TPA: helicase-related protein [Nitrososphaerales archaeon]|nr:helicase-related protein [Nitrososphaerales archaeon]
MATRFIEHDNVTPESLQVRSYQVDLAAICYNENILLVVPTGLGKTAIALLVVAEYLKNHPDKKCLLLAPTRPLCHQHYNFFQKHLLLDEDKIQVLTGKDPMNVRKKKWEQQVICATPQITVGDLKRGLLDIEDFSILIFDEAHRAVGEYAYCHIGRNYKKISSKARMVGLTASLPDDETRIKEMLTNLSFDRIEFRDELSEDVKPYVQKTKLEWKKIPLPPLLLDIRSKLKNSITIRLKRLEESGNVRIKNKNNISMKNLLDLRTEVEKLDDSQAKSDLISSIRLSHAINLLETQSIQSFLKFFDRLSKRYSGVGLRQLLEDPQVKSAYESARGASLLGVEHPKIDELKILLKSLGKHEKAIVFTGYRDSVDSIYTNLASNKFRVRFLIGKSGKGQRQNEQVKTIEDMNANLFDILVATQVGEEGLDISECSLVVFYDNVPSAVRFVQRRGRTGREAPGRVVVLIAQGTRDEIYYWAGRRKMKSGRQIVAKMQKSKQDSKGPMDNYVENSENLPLVYVDARESLLLVDELKKRGCRVDVQTLIVGDFIVSKDVIIERKTGEDFVKSVIDGRLFKQLVAMRETYSRPVLILEGERKRATGIGTTSLFGALASVVSDFGVSIFMSSGHEETSQIIFHIARREQIEKKKKVIIRSRKILRHISDTQKYVVSGLPGVNTVLAERLLIELKTISSIFGANEAELKQVEGIGEKLAKNIKDIAKKEYEPSSD